MNEKLSDYMDGDLSFAPQVIDTLRNDRDAREAWTIYHLLGDVMRGLTTPDDGFSKRIFTAMKDVQIEAGYDPLI
jgi:negative regulator of sigma E activity